MRDVVTNLLKAALMECCSPRFVDKTVCHPCFEHAIREAEKDLDAFATKDPASRGSMVAIAQGYTSYKAVAHYRLVRAMTLMIPTSEADKAELDAGVFLISSRGKLMSGAEIHARCQIGRRFVLDHGGVRSLAKLLSSVTTVMYSVGLRSARRGLPEMHPARDIRRWVIAFRLAPSVGYSAASRLVTTCSSALIASLRRTSRQDPLSR